MMTKISVGNAPCSWGNLEFEGVGENKLTCERMLNELVDTGYTGTELGDWGFMPTTPDALAGELRQRKLAMNGAFVPVALRNPSAHASGEDAALRTAHLIASAAAMTGQSTQPFLVLADDNGSVPLRTQNAGSVTRAMGLNDADWRIFADGANRIAGTVFAATGLRTVFHHHCAGFVETPDEIARLLALTDPQVLGLVFDTGHYAFGAGGCETVLSALDRYADRIWYVHLKDCSPTVAAQARADGWDYFASVRNGIFCELGQGCVDFAGVKTWLEQHNYQGFVTVEQDVLPGMGMPKESAERNRVFLRGVGL
jgi:inosose dehydratase